MNYVVVDFETSGRSPWYHDIVSTGIVVLDDNLEITNTFYDVCCPWDIRNFNHETTGVHGFSKFDLIKFQSSKSLCYKAMNFLNPYRNQKRIEYIPLIHHSQNQFDFLFFHNMFLKNELQFSFYKMFHRDHTFSTIEIGRDLMYERNSLKAWCERIGHDIGEHHKAIDDAIAAAKIFKFQMIDLQYKEKLYESKALKANYQIHS